MATELEALDAAADTAVREHTTTTPELPGRVFDLRTGYWALTLNGIVIVPLSGREAGEVLDFLGVPRPADCEADDAGAEFADEGPSLAEIGKLCAWGAAILILVCVVGQVASLLF